jgi:drug/metabolite transporter (DMT)-like permease
VAARTASVVLIGASAGVARRSVRLPARAAPAVAASGIGDVTANVLYLIATQHGSLAITGVVGSLYPASTVLLAQVVLRERLVRSQAAGLAAAVAAVVLISLPS